MSTIHEPQNIRYACWNTYSLSYASSQIAYATHSPKHNIQPITIHNTNSSTLQERTVKRTVDKISNLNGYLKNKVILSEANKEYHYGLVTASDEKSLTLSNPMNCKVINKI